MAANARMSRAVPPLALALSGLPILLGIFLHASTTSKLIPVSWISNTYLAGGIFWPFVAVMVLVAVSNRVDYRRPVYIGDTITTRVEVARLEPARNRATMAVTWRNQAGDLVAEGEVVLKPPPAPER